jgi:ATP-dependent Clp protease ATP-binding subunit ClpA
MKDLFVWQKNFLRAVKTHSVVVLHGNIRDMYIYLDRPHHREVRLDELTTRLLHEQYGKILRYDPYTKVAELSLGEANIFKVEEVEGFGNRGFTGQIESVIARIVTDLENKGHHKVWMLKYMHNVLPYKNSYSQEESLGLIAFQQMIENIAPDNRLILCYISDTQVPIEISENSHRVALVKIPMPDFKERQVFWREKLLIRHEGASNELAELAENLAKLTDGLALTSLRTLVILAEEEAERSERKLNSLTLRDWENVIARYKFGDTQDFYQQITPEQLNSAKHFFIEKEGVRGQEHAVLEAVKMLWKARTNVSSLLRGTSNAPRGVLFFCGPSGTGKTMLSKKLAKFVFGSEEAFHRFDMSEYQQDYTISKLIGSPPGYVGYERGGLLTGAVLEKPFSVILFDEIEKAHPRIFDIFLQILSDGRLTDSRGQVVFFSEAIIIFTSNLGTRASEINQLMEAQQSNNPEQVRQHFIKCVRNFFRFEISRPELLNRIGNNIVPFNYLDNENVLEMTVHFYLKTLQNRFDEEYTKNNLRLDIKFDSVQRFIVENHGNSIREFGGRAVLNILDHILLQKLAKVLIHYEAKPPDKLTVITVTVGNNEEGKQDILVRK